MGNRAVICSKEVTKENADNHVGIYVHWCGSRSQIKHFLKLAKEKEIRDIISDPEYCLARLCQVIGNELDNANTGLGVGIVSQLDCHNGDNGVYYIDENFEIVRQTTGRELEP